MIPNLTKPLDCYYTEDCIKDAARFEFRTIGAGCIDCPLTNSTTCDYFITLEERQAMQADPDTWSLIAHCNSYEHLETVNAK